MQFTGFNKLVLAMSILAAATCAQAGAAPANGQEHAATVATQHPPFGAAPHGADGHAIALSQTEFKPAVTRDPPSDVPEPASIALFGLGLAGVLMVRRRK